MLDALVFSAGAFPVLDRAENAFAEQAAFFRLERAVIDGLGIFDFAFAHDRMASGDASVMPT